MSLAQKVGFPPRLGISFAALGRIGYTAERSPDMPTFFPPLHNPDEGYGQLSITGSALVNVIGHSSATAGVWGIVGPVAEVDKMKANGPTASGGVVAYSMAADIDALYAESTERAAITATGHAETAPAVQATHYGTTNAATAIQGASNAGRGVAGFSSTWQGVYGFSKSQAGVVGESNGFDGVYGVSHSSQHAGTTGINQAAGMGVFGNSGLDATGKLIGGGVAIRGVGNGTSIGVDGISDSGWGIHGLSQSGLAGFFEGNVEITGKLTVHGDICFTPVGADIAETFARGEDGIEPGTVVVLSGEDTVETCRTPYDSRVAGVVSGAGGFRPAVVLAGDSPERCPLALAGRAYCKVDASASSIAVGDLLTTSATPGHAMKAVDPSRTPGAIIGKALRALDEGTGLIPILVLMR
jgi:hypothetical protein